MHRNRSASTALWIPVLSLISLLGCYREEMPESAESDVDWDNLDVNEQRDRLPAAAQDCHDDVVGVWQGQSLLSNSWHHFTLDIKRKSSNAGEIEGTIYTEVWTGTEKDEEPPECVDDGHVHYTLEQPAEGRYEDGVLTITGQSIENETKHCGQLNNYFADSFTGQVSVGMNEFRVINDDGWNPPSPLLFRRTECEQRPAIFRTWPLKWLLYD